MSLAQPRGSLDGLPRQFIQSLRTLFDILDEGRTGFVHFIDIENRWREDGNDGVAGLPKGVLEALRKVTPDSGKLSFERFVAGLKIALLRSKSTETKKEYTSHSRNNGIYSQRPDVVSSHASNGLSRQPTNRGYTPPLSHSQTNQYSNLATVRPSNYEYLEKNRPRSASDVEKKSERERYTPDSLAAMMPPPVQPPPVRQEFATSWRSKSTSQMQSGSRSNKENIENPWQLRDSDPGGKYLNRGFGDGRASIASTSALDQLAKELPKTNLEEVVLSPSGRRGPRRRDSRRHTLSNGIDFNTIKRLKQLEQEKDTLLRGLEAVNEAQDWYQGQIATVTDRIKTIGTGGNPDYSVEAHQERMNFLAARISELNQQIRALVDSSRKGFPLHMNLALSQAQRQEPSETDNLIAMLKAQNKMLKQEVGQKTDKIGQLEREKTTLVREVFESRSSKNGTNSNDTTFL